MAAEDDNLRPGEYSDPEGNEYHVMADASAPARRLSSILFDVLDPEGLTAFWAEATGYTIVGTGTRCDPRVRELTL